MEKRYEENIENVRFGVGLGRVLGGSWESLERIKISWIKATKKEVKAARYSLLLLGVT